MTKHKSNERDAYMKKLEDKKRKNIENAQNLIDEEARITSGAINNLIEELVGRVKALKKEERHRILFLIDQAIQDHLFVEKEMLERESVTCSYHFFDVHERGLKVLEQLKECIASEKTSFESVAPPQPLVCGKDTEESYVGVCKELEAMCEDEEGDGGEKSTTIVDDVSGDDEPTEFDDVEKLIKHIISIMQMTGTVKDGNSAWWTLDDLGICLSKLYPFLDDKTLTRVIEHLSEDHVIIPLIGGKFALSDNFAIKLEDDPIDETILTILKSAKEENGEYCGWTQNQLMFAAKRTSAKLSEKAILQEMESLIQKGRIASFDGKTTRYVAIDEETMKLYKEKLVAIGHEPTPEEAKTEEPVKSAGSNGDPKTWNGVKKAFNINEETDVIAQSLITHMRREPKRLWRDYDIEGLYNTAMHKITMTDPDGKPGELRMALDSLVEHGLVEHIPRDTRPGIHDERWGLTELGRLMGK